MAVQGFLVADDTDIVPLPVNSSGSGKVSLQYPGRHQGHARFAEADDRCELD